MDNSSHLLAAYCALMACFLVAMDKRSGVRPVGIGEMLRQGPGQTRYEGIWVPGEDGVWQSSAVRRPRGWHRRCNTCREIEETLEGEAETERGGVKET